MLIVWNTQAEMYMGNTIEYVVKSYQVKTTIVKCKNVLQEYSNLTIHKNICDNDYGEISTIDKNAENGYYLVNWTSLSYTF